MTSHAQCERFYRLQTIKLRAAVELAVDRLTLRSTIVADVVRALDEAFEQSNAEILAFEQGLCPDPE